MYSVGYKINRLICNRKLSPQVTRCPSLFTHLTSSGLVGLLLAGCFFASSATPFPAAALVLPAAAAAAAAAGATGAALAPPISSSFHPLCHKTNCLSATLRYSHPQKVTTNRVERYRYPVFLSAYMSGLGDFLDNTAAVTEVLPEAATSCCILGSVPLTNMADAFGDGLFSVFDDEQQTTTSKKIPASLTPDIGKVVGKNDTEKGAGPSARAKRGPDGDFGDDGV
ncbi:hypothetical protein D9C73_018912 [Collichthys lucidus]|uniref:Uncharacterized protein n=1 Tax=Collichthys lucidus TaxID=240159 RepID=A0A4U5VA44_COLLU|nr:hypothetical protein D9C73_018912 [Collichthys lucidus]